MRFDLLDEYSTLVPFGLGDLRKGPSQYPAVPAEVAKCGIIAKFDSHLQWLGEVLGARGRMALSNYRSLVARRHLTTSDSRLHAER